MSYELLQQEPASFILAILLSLVITLVAYGAFPLIFARVRKDIIAKKEYNILCYCINFLVMMVFIAINGKASSGGAYLIWTCAFSASGLKTLKRRGVLEGSQPIESTETPTNQASEAIDTRTTEEYLDEETFIRDIEHYSLDGPWHQYDILIDGCYGWNTMIRMADHMAESDLEDIDEVQIGGLGGWTSDITESYKNSNGKCAETPEILDEEAGNLSIAGRSKALCMPLKMVWFNQTAVLRVFTWTTDEVLIRKYVETAGRRTFGTENAMKLGKPVPPQNNDEEPARDYDGESPVKRDNPGLGYSEVSNTKPAKKEIQGPEQVRPKNNKKWIWWCIGAVAAIIGITAAVWCTLSPSYKNAVEYSLDLPSGTKAYVEIVAMEPCLGIKKSNSSKLQSTIYKCTTTSGETIWVQMGNSEFEKTLVDEVQNEVYEGTIIENAYYVWRLFGTVGDAEKICEGLSAETAEKLLKQVKQYTRILESESLNDSSEGDNISEEDIDAARATEITAIASDFMAGFAEPISKEVLILNLILSYDMTEEEAKYATENCYVDWNEMALYVAQDLVQRYTFSYTGLLEHLQEIEGFSSSEAAYAVDNGGFDWYEQACRAIMDYLQSDDFTDDELRTRLEYDGFQKDEIEYGLTNYNADALADDTANSLTISTQLDEDKREKCEGGRLFVLRQDKDYDDGGLSVVFFDGGIQPDENGLLTVNYRPVFLWTDGQQETYMPVPVMATRNLNANPEYYIGTCAFGDIVFGNFGRMNLSLKGTQPVITECFIEEDDGSELEVSMDDYEYISIMCVNRIPVYDDNGELLPIEVWEKTSRIGGYSYYPGNSYLTFGEISSDDADKYYYYFDIYDGEDFVCCTELLPLFS